MAVGQPPSDGDSSRAGTFIIIAAVTIGIAYLLTCARIYVRARIVRALALDDLFIVLSLVRKFSYIRALLPFKFDSADEKRSEQICSSVSLGFAIASTRYGLGRHLHYIPLEQFIEAIKYIYLAEPVIILSGMFSRISICFLLLRIFVTSRRWKIALWTFICFIAATCLSCTLTLLFQCQPMAKFWNPFLPGTCWSPETQINIEYFMGGNSPWTTLMEVL